jgi:hypothetical protein
MKNNYISQCGLTIITPIDTTREIGRLYALLNAIGDDVNNQDVINFKAMKKVHFARWFIIEGARDASDTVFENSLVLATDFDGETDEHLREMVAVAGPGIDKIYSFCKNYPARGSNSPEEVIRYFKSHSQKNQLFWSCLRGGTVKQLVDEEKLRHEIQRFLETERKKADLDKMQPEEIRARIKKFVSENPALSWALQKRASPKLAWKVNYYGKLILRLLLILVLLPILIFVFIPVWVFILSRIFEKKDKHTTQTRVDTEEMKQLLQREDHIFMNQFTIYGTIKKPYWYRLTTLKLALWLFSTNGTYRSNRGKLSGIETIHFARWCIFNQGKNVMFLSNYDGGWEIYLSQFIDRSAAAMNLTFGTTVGYPPVRYLFWGGAFDEQAFKTVVRNNQYPTQVFYSAYPYATAKNQLNNAGIRKGLNGESKESCTEWLKRL